MSPAGSFRGIEEKSSGGIHDQARHQGSEKTSILARECCYWSFMADDTKAGPHLKTSMGVLIAMKPLEVLAIDFTVLEPSGATENWCLTKFKQAIPSRDKLLITHWFVRFGVPLRIRSDHGRNFESNLIQELYSLYGIKKTQTTPYQPEGNGQCKRFNRILHVNLRTLQPDQKRRWKHFLPEVVYAYNCTSHLSTGYSPYYMIYRSKLRLLLDHVLGATWVGDDADADMNKSHLILLTMLSNKITIRTHFFCVVRNANMRQGSV